MTKGETLTKGQHLKEKCHSKWHLCKLLVT